MLWRRRNAAKRLLRWRRNKVRYFTKKTYCCASLAMTGFRRLIGLTLKRMVRPQLAKCCPQKLSHWIGLCQHLKGDNDTFNLLVLC